MGLKYEISPENAPKFAADIAAVAEENTGEPIDYSIESLEVIDDIIGSFHEQGVELERVEATMFGFGCYVGEVFVKNANARWRMCTDDEYENLFGVPMILEMGEDNLVNPIGKVIKRLENGEEDNLPYFYHVFTSPDVQSKIASTSYYGYGIVLYHSFLHSAPLLRVLKASFWMFHNQTSKLQALSGTTASMILNDRNFTPKKVRRSRMMSGSVQLGDSLEMFYGQAKRG